MPNVIFKDLGLVDYKATWDYQEELLNNIVQQKIKARQTSNLSSAASSKDDITHPTPNYLLFCEHPHVYTLGKSGSEDSLLIDEKKLDENQVTFYRINRGGDITYHGPGQIVGYPILNLDYFFNDIHKYLRYLEEAIIRMLAEYNITGSRIDKLTGVWLDAEDKIRARKICAFGVRCSRWVTMHGFALNVNTDLKYFNHIVPCGISDKGVTSMKQELGKEIDMEDVKEKIRKHFAEIFNCTLIEEKEATIPVIKLQNTTT
jgi:lipoyl(octanoyl) transferase